MSSEPLWRRAFLAAKRPEWRVCLSCVLLWGVLLLILWAAIPGGVGRVWKIEGDGSARVPVSLPWFGGEAPGSYRFETELLRPVKSVSVRADDCVELVEVDGQRIFVAEPSECLHCAYTTFEMPSTLGPGRHSATFTIRNVRGEVWFDIRESRGFGLLKVAGLFVFGTGCFLLVARSGYPPWVGLPIALADLLAVQYLAATSPWLRQHDVGGHREYIAHLLEHCALPAVQQGWETWQPPLYYVLAAGWQTLFSGLSFDDVFRSVQFLSAALYVGTLVFALVAFRRFTFTDIEAFGGLCGLALVPGYLFFAARINNDVLLPVLGGAALLATAEFARCGDRRWLWFLGASLAAMLATKGSSLAIAGGALAVVFWTEMGRSDWRSATWRTYLTGLPAGIWLLFWFTRTAVQTGNPLYVNDALPDSLRILHPAWQRLLSFDLAGFTGGHFYYDQEMRLSYPTAMVTSLLYGEYGMGDYGFHASAFLRWGCLGMLLVLAAGVLVRPRRELTTVWATCLTFGACQAAITVMYAVKFPFACNQNMRFLAQAFVPLACFFGLGVGHFWRSAGLAGRGTLFIMTAVFLFGLGDFVLQVMF